MLTHARRTLAVRNRRGPQPDARRAIAHGAAPATGGEVIEAAGAPMAPVAAGDAQAQADALSALVNLGYGAGEAATAIAGVGAVDAAGIIRGALRALAPKG